MMKNYLVLGLALFLATSFTPAKAADSCPNLALVNAVGSPPVVHGNVIQFAGWGISPSMDIYLDNAYATSVYDAVTPIGQWFYSGGSLWVPHGTHTLRNALEACTITFSSVSVPGVPTLSTNRTHVGPNFPYTLSWTVPSGSINHYTLHTSNANGSQSDRTLPGNSTAVTLQNTTPAGTIKALTYTIRACSSSNDDNCSAWSNAVLVEIEAPCGHACP
jgi:hypothetical protein